MNGENASKKVVTNSSSSSSTKCCADCKTTRTPLWRVGPSGPKSLCNACGIRYRKRRVSVGSPQPATSPDRKRERPPQLQVPVDRAGGSDAGKGLSETVRMSLVLMGEDLVIQGEKKQRCLRKRKLCEEELAAVSLMALSCGCVFA